MRQTVAFSPDPRDLDTLLRAANAGDQVAYATFLRSVTPILRGVVRGRGAGGLGEAACEDILQEVLLAIHLKRHTWRGSEPVRPWLYAIARFKVVDAFRARGRRIHLPVEDFADILPAPEGVDPTERGDIETMLAQLDQRTGDIVRGIGLDGASIGETGARFGMTEGAVRVALHRGLKRLAALRGRFME